MEGQTDEFAIYALLYEAKGKDGKEVTLTGIDINTSEYIVLKAEVTDKTAKEDWTYFEIPFEKMNDKEYDAANQYKLALICTCLLYTSPSPRDRTRSRMPSSA